MGMHTRTLCLYIERYLEKNEIEDVLKELGFEKIGSEGQNYQWYDSRYSIFGCRLTFQHDQKISIIDNQQEVEKVYKTVCQAIIHKPNAPRDRKVQNEVLKSLQTKFGGLIYQPEYDKNEFFKEDTTLSATEEECAMTYLHFKENLERGQRLIKEVKGALSSQYTDILIYDPSLLNNNTLLPFFVSSLETFVKSFFEQYIKNNELSISNDWYKNNSKVDLIGVENIIDILNEKKRFFNVLVYRVKWQNLKKVANAYNVWLDFDLKTEVLEKEFEFGNTNYKIGAVLDEFIKTRHSLVHEAKMDLTLGKEKMEKLLICLEHFGDLFMRGFMEKHNLRIDEYSIYNS
ncbi:HEPN domain-containing protein [Bacillus sp. H1m]|uniref:HEPN domain-containing protein n=1 Tax=Bacillus sp. H1m TaxID=1397277 RepID=UPI000469CBB9|nr:HEPN domain-containing protein [Bacillus sp. H1m]